MRFKTVLISLSLMAFATAMLVQTNISGTAQCGKPDTQQKIDIPDHPRPLALHQPSEMHLDQGAGSAMAPEQRRSYQRHGRYPGQ